MLPTDYVRLAADAPLDATLAVAEALGGLVAEEFLAGRVPEGLWCWLEPVGWPPLEPGSGQLDMLGGEVA